MEGVYSTIYFIEHEVKDMSVTHVRLVITWILQKYFSRREA